VQKLINTYMPKKGFIIIVAFFSFASCKSKQESTTPSIENITESIYASGIVKSRNQYQVFSTVNGVAAEILVTEGDTVKKGQPLIRLTNTTQQLNTQNALLAANYAATTANQEKLNEQKISIDLAKAKLDNDALMLQRQRNLWQQQIGTQNDLDAKELAYKNSSIAYESARLRYEELQKQVSFQEKQALKNVQISQTAEGDYTIKSNADGRVYHILVKKGEMVTIQNPAALVGAANDFYLELQVDEYDIARVKPGQKILLSMDSYKGQVFEATVERVIPLMNDKTRSFTVEAGFAKRPPALYPSLTCEANIVIQTKEKALTIPRSYLQNNETVLLANKQPRKVTTGLKDYQKVEILRGLTANDVIYKPAP
jgi:HlyD family secretion protein